MFDGTAALKLIRPISQLGRRDKRGHPPFEPSLENRHQVELLAAYGFTHREIREFIINPVTGRPISLRVLQDRFRQELAWGAVKAKAKVASNLYRIALGKGCAAVSACKFWLKTRCGWCDKCGSRCRPEPANGGAGMGVIVAPAGVTPSEWCEEQLKSGERLRT